MSDLRSIRPSVSHWVILDRELGWTKVLFLAPCGEAAKSGRGTQAVENAVFRIRNVGDFGTWPHLFVDVQCVAVIVTGASSNGTLLRYQTARYGSREVGSRRGSPNGSLNTNVVSRDDRVTEGWKGDKKYHFRIERSAQGDLEVQLDNGDPSQKRRMVIPGGMNYGRLAVSVVSAPLGPARELTIRGNR